MKGWNSGVESVSLKAMMKDIHNLHQTAGQENPKENSLGFG